MIYLNVYSDPKMSEQICIELNEKLGKIGLSGKIFFCKIDTSIFATFLLERFSILSVYIYIFFKLMIDFKFRKHTRLQLNQETAKFF